MSDDDKIDFTSADSRRPTEEKPRMAKCDCGALEVSDKGLAFFQKEPENEFDRWYCGHSGWD